HFHDIGDYLSREDKLEKISAYVSVAGIPAGAWQAITPDEHGDWLKQRDDSFGQFIGLGNKKDVSEVPLFEIYSNGVKTNRDAWAYNASKTDLTSNMERMIEFYNSEVDRFEKSCVELSSQEREDQANAFIDTDPQKISWDH